MLRDWGQDRKYHHVLRGYNYRMEGFQGADLAREARHLNDWTEAAAASCISTTNFWRTATSKLPTEMPWGTHVYHVYTLRVNDRDDLHAASGCGRNPDRAFTIPIPAHLQPAYADLGYGRGAFPHSEEAATEGALAAVVS